jgi:hypothetical protein
MRDNGVQITQVDNYNLELFSIKNKSFLQNNITNNSFNFNVSDQMGQFPDMLSFL